MSIHIYTDGSSLGNPGPGGWGVVITNYKLPITNKDQEIIKELGGYDKNTTNNRMELMAVIKTLEYLCARQNLTQKSEVLIYADSAYVLGGVTSWVTNWEKNGWKTSKKEPVLNQDLWKELMVLVRSYKGTLSWQKVKGHAGHVYNERADEIATTCAEKQSAVGF